MARPPNGSQAWFIGQNDYKLSDEGSLAKHALVLTTVCLAEIFYELVVDSQWPEDVWLCSQV